MPKLTKEQKFKKLTEGKSFFYLRHQKKDGSYHRFGCVAFSDRSINKLNASIYLHNPATPFDEKKARTTALNQLNAPSKCLEVFKDQAYYNLMASSYMRRMLVKYYGDYHRVLNLEHMRNITGAEGAVKGATSDSATK